MTEKQYYCDDPLEYRSYGIFDLSKADKTKEDFWDDEEECYIGFQSYLVDSTDSMLTGEEVTKLLNKQDEEIQRLEKDLKSKKPQLFSKRKLEKENQELKEALLFYLDCTTCECAVKFDDSMDKWCNILLGCSYQKAKEKYGDFKYAQRWELDE